MTAPRLFFYKDLNKSCKDLLNDDFFFTQKFKIKSRAADGVTWTSEGELSQKGALGRLTAAYKHPSGVSLDKLQLKTDGRVQVEASMALDDALRFTVAAEDGRQEPGKPQHSYGRLGMELQKPSASANVELDIVNGPALKAAAVLARGNTFVGGELNYNTHLEERERKPEFIDYNVGAGYRGLDWEASVSTSDKLGAVHVHYMQKVTPEVDVGAAFKYKFNEDMQQLTVGCAYRPDALTTFKAKFNTNALLSMSFSQKISKYVRLTLAGEADTQEWAADSHKFGLGLTLFD